ncbi:Vps54-domain-containing protein [Gonapodya prolifera JEL478]|uniref:Vacuolar protein sorting-associated protein 54 n=1 Tax=Gonapodya prolifera (strain JEL478) TaxID=1344416 RepID=A0A139AXM1_GONPJ|nr:Vps54-domain-containing protein [Gonapodya prolifera JEL478]|eukprot:KXS21457.1 Vps54-domain-containing protein [Gonapodya prolifera JEL478]
MAQTSNPFEDATNQEHPWTVKDIGVNAISGIMNDPASQSKGSQKATKLEIPPIPPTAIRKVRLAEFDPYLKAIADVYEKYQFNRAMGLEGTPILAADAGESSSFKNLYDVSKSITEDSSSQEEIAANLAVLDSNNKPRAKPYVKNVPAVDSVPAIYFGADFSLEDPDTFRTITSMIDDSDEQSADGIGGLFSGSSLQEKLSHYLDIVEVHLIREISLRSSSFFSALVNLQRLHAETVDCVQEIKELQLGLADVSKISSKQGLEVVRLKRRRENLSVLFASLKTISNVHEAQPIIRALIEQSDYIGALDVIEETAKVIDGSQPGGQTLEVSSSLDQGLEYRNLAAVPLRDVVALGPQQLGLTETIRSLHATMEADIVDILLTDVRESVNVPMDHQTPGKVGGTAAPNFTAILEQSPSSTSAAAQQLEQRLFSLTAGLLRMGKFGSAVQSYRDAVMKEIKTSTKKLYPPPITEKGDKAGAGVNQGIMKEKERKQAAFANQLRSMTFDAFADLLMRIFSTVLFTLQRVALGQRVLLKLISDAQTRGIVVHDDFAKLYLSGDVKDFDGKGEDEDDDLEENFDRFPGTKSGVTKNATSRDSKQATDSGNEAQNTSSAEKEAYQAMTSEIAELCGLVTDYAHMRAAKLLGVRSDQNAKLNAKDFFRFFSSTSDFVTVGEQLCGRMCFGLKGTIMSQAKAFLHNFHDEKMKQTATLIENEPWAQSPVPVDFQHIADKLVDAGSELSTKANAEIHVSMDLADIRDVADDEDDDGRSPEEGGGSKASDDSTTTSKFLLVRKQRFYIVGSVLIVVRNLSEYEECVENIPSLCNDTLQCMLEVISLFNSRMCQVILGAGAVASVGLKTITAKHLALASQSLAVVIALIPFLKHFFLKNLANKQSPLIGDFDKKVKDLQDHQSQIHQKLVSIMNERLVVHRRVLQSTNWDDWSADHAPGSDDASKPSNYMQSLVKDLITLHKVLSKYLHTETLKVVFAEVFRSYTSKLEEDLKKLDVHSSVGKNRLLIDFQFFIQKLSSLDGIDGPGNHLEVVVNNMKIKERKGQTIASQPGPQPARSVTPTATPLTSQTTQPTASASATNISQRFRSLLSNNLPPPPK